MSRVTVSSKFQIVIPRDIREELGVTPGSTFEMVSFRGRIELIPVGEMSDARGMLRRIDTTVEREQDRL